MDLLIGQVAALTAAASGGAYSDLSPIFHISLLPLQFLFSWYGLNLESTRASAVFYLPGPKHRVSKVPDRLIRAKIHGQLFASYFCKLCENCKTPDYFAEQKRKQMC